MKRSEYLSVGLSRVGKYTQLTVLLESLVNRKITVDVFNPEQSFVFDLVTRTVSHILSAQCVQEGESQHANFERETF